MNKLCVIILFFILILLLFYKNNIKKGGNNIEAYNNIDSYVINLDRSNDRLLRFNKIVNKENLNVKRFKAVDGKLLNESFIKKIDENCVKFREIGLRPKNWVHNMGEGQIGAYLSHINVWKKIKKDRYLMIFEDDIIISNNFIKKLNIVMSELPKDWDMLLIGWWRTPGNFDKAYYKENENISEHLQKTKYPFLGAYGYIINESFIKKIKSFTNINNIYIPIDNVLSRSILNMNIYNTKKPLVKTNLDLNSTVRDGKKYKETTQEMLNKQELL